METKTVMVDGTEQKIEVGNVEPQLFTEYRVVGFGTDPTDEAHIAEPVRIFGQIQEKCTLPWCDWVPDGEKQVKLIVDGEDELLEESDDDGNFDFVYRFRTVGMHYVRVQALNFYDDVITETQPNAINIITPVPPPPTPPSFWETLRNLDFEDMWLYHKDKVVGIGIGGVALVTVEEVIR